MIRGLLCILSCLAVAGAAAWGCYATSGGPDPSAYPMPDDNHQPIDINAMRRDR